MAYKIRSSEKYTNNKVSSDPFWDHLEHKWPDLYLGQLRRYLEYKIEPSHSLWAILTNDLMEANARCDSHTWRHLGDWCKLLFNDIPSRFRGEENVREWLTKSDAYDAWVDYYVPWVMHNKDRVIADGWKEFTE